MTSNTDHIVENKLLIDDEYLKSVVHEIFVGEVRIFFVNHRIKRAKIFHPREGYPPIQMHFLLKGKNTMKSNQTGDVCTFTSDQNNLVYFPHTDMDYTMGNSEVHLLGIQFQKKFFYRFVDEHSKLLSSFWNNVEKKEETRLVSGRNLSLTPKIRIIISEIINSKREGYLKKLFLESKIIELLMLQLEQAKYDADGPLGLTINKEDKDKLYAVKELLEQNLLLDFTLNSLSLKVGLNEFKLKKGFKELFGKTVFTYFNDLRMEHAKKLIMDDRKMIYEVADMLGYSESHHFSHAFKKKFGMSPSTLK